MAYRTVTEHQRIYPWTSLMASPYSCDSTGTVDCVTSINTLKADLANVGTIYVPKGTFKISLDLTIPVGIVLVFAADGMFSVDVGKTLTISGKIVAGPWQIFTGAGTVSVGSINRIQYGEWTGSSGTTIVGGLTIASPTFSDPTFTGTTTQGATNFSVIPELPAANPTTGNQASRKTYVDTKVSLTGDEAIAGIKTFSSIPVLPAADPTTANQAVRKSYVDGMTGRVVQVVYTETGAYATASTGIPFDDTIPQIGEGTEYMTLDVTPTSATNLLKIDVVFYCAVASLAPVVALFRDATANALAVGGYTTPTANNPTMLSFTHFVVAGSVAATTFRVRAGTIGGVAALYFNGSSAARIFGGVCASSITITEITV